MKFEDFKKSFFIHSTNKKELVKNIKIFHADYKNLNKFIVRYIKEFSSAKSLLKNAILGTNYLPKSYSQLSTYDYQSYSNSLEMEMNWQVVSFIECSDIINQFIYLKDEFDNLLFIGDFDNARKILDKIESEICVSYWSIENRFIIDEYQFGTEKNWDTRNIILDKKNNAFVKVLGNLFSLKTEKRISFFQYNDDFNNWQDFEGLNKSDVFNGVIEYFRFKANYFSYTKYNHLPEILFRESNSSIIDRYLTFVRIAQIAITENYTENQFILYLLKELDKNINDICLKQMICSLDSTFNFHDIDSSTEIIKIIDEYTRGNYLQSKEMSKSYFLSKSSSVIELYEIYSKSLIELGLPYEAITENNSFTNEITQLYYEILDKDINTDNALVELVKLSYVFNNSYLGLHLYSFITEQLNWSAEINYSFLVSLNSKFINPKNISHLLKNQDVAKVYLDNLKQTLNDSVTVDVFNTFYENYISDTPIKDYNDIPIIKNEIYKTRTLFTKNKLNECIAICNLLLNKIELSKIAEYEIVSTLYSCYLKNNDYRNCLKINVDTFLKNANLTKRMNVSKLIPTILKSKFKNIGSLSELIELPIFLKINYTDRIKIKQAYELFLFSNNLTKPSELFSIKDNFSDSKFIFFLKNVCIPEIMQLSKSFNSSYEVNEERIIICKYLAEIDKSEDIAYKIEIAELTQKNTISKVIGGIDERKIFVNELKIRQTIKKSEKQNVLQSEQLSPLTNESFERYINLLNFVKNNNEYKDVSSIIQFGDNGELTFIEAEKNKVYNENDVDVVLYIPAFRIFVTYFIHIRDLFIFSKEYGLDAYLSTRIRHGTLPNHLRSVFENYYLVTAQTDNIYADNLYWSEKLELSEENLFVIQKLLADFSLEIDAFSKEIKDNYIQCKNEKKNQNSNSLFDYSYTEEDLIFLFLEEFSTIENIDDFIDKSFNVLWLRTEKNLEIIRNKFNIEFRDKYVSLIDNLQTEITSTVNKNSVSELLNNIMTCRTEIQTKLSNISKWFRPSESSFDGEYELQILVETSVQITKNLNPSFHFEIDKDICKDFNIYGEYHQHIIDLINNCLFNIVKHSELTCEKTNAKLKIEEKDNNLILNFENNILDASKHEEKLKTIKVNWSNSDTNISKEGGTGFPKIKKIIHTDLNRKYSYFDFTIDNDKLNIIISFEIKGLKYEDINN